MSTPTLTSQPAASSPGVAGIEPAARSQRAGRDPESAEQFAAAVADVLTPTTVPGSGKNGQPGRAPSGGHRPTTAQPTDSTQPAEPAAQPTVAAAALAALVVPSATSTPVVPVTGVATSPVLSPVLSGVGSAPVDPAVGEVANPAAGPIAGPAPTQPDLPAQPALTALTPLTALTALTAEPAAPSIQGGGPSAAGAGVEATLVVRQPLGPKLAGARPPATNGPEAAPRTVVRAEVPPRLTLVQALSTPAATVTVMTGGSAEGKPPVVPAVPVAPVVPAVPLVQTQAQTAGTGTGAVAASDTAAVATPAVSAEVAVATETMPRDLRHRSTTTAAARPTVDPGSMQATAPTQATPRTTEVTAATVPTTGSQVAAQVAHVIAPLRLGPDGSHVVTVELHPAELGSVRVTVELRDGAMHVQLSGGAVAVDALRSSLPDLRHQLEQLGTPATSIDVTAHGFNRSPDQQPGSTSGTSAQPEREPDQRARSRDPDPLPPHPPKPSAGRALLDLRM